MSVLSRSAAGMALMLSLAWGQEARPMLRLADLRLNTLSGAQVPFSQLTGSTTVVAFISAQCPISNAFNDRMTAVYNDYAAKNVKFVFIDANGNETALEVTEHRKSAGFPFPVYLDSGNQVSDRFGAMATPETFIIDATATVRYHGYIEDSTNEARVKNRALRRALDAVLAGHPVPVSETKAFGCTIKRARRTT